MYRSRPRYSRYTSEFELPKNYSGNAFAKDSDLRVAPMVDEPEYEEVNDEMENFANEAREEAGANSIPTSVSVGNDRKSVHKPTGFGFDLGRLFGGQMGFEELLIIGLILLMAQNEGNDDVIVLLILLLFIK